MVPECVAPDARHSSRHVFTERRPQRHNDHLGRFSTGSTYPCQTWGRRTTRTYCTGSVRTHTNAHKHTRTQHTKRRTQTKFGKPRPVNTVRCGIRYCIKAFRWQGCWVGLDGRGYEGDVANERIMITTDVYGKVDVPWSTSSEHFLSRCSESFVHGMDPYYRRIL